MQLQREVEVSYYRE